MDPISNVDRLVLILRQRLAERSRINLGRPQSTRKDQKQQASERSYVEALAAMDAIDDQQFGRALIQNILAEQFGSHVVNEAKFQQTVERVTGALREDPALSELLTRVVRDLRASAA